MLKGTAQMEKGDYVQAIASFQEGNKIYSSDVRLLNLLGRCYYRSGRKAQALGVLRSSLKLNPKQPDVKKLIAEIEK
jgi:Flp pilus assembly protein TadD